MQSGESCFMAYGIKKEENRETLERERAFQQLSRASPPLIIVASKWISIPCLASTYIDNAFLNT